MVEVTGYVVKRDDFEPDFDPEAEMPLGELEIPAASELQEGDAKGKADREAKLRQLVAYHARLQERHRRRDFALQRGLLNVKAEQAADKKRTPEQRAFHAAMRVFARFQEPAQHDALVAGLLRERELRQRLGDLMEQRRMGVRTRREAEAFARHKQLRTEARKAQLAGRPGKSASAVEGAGDATMGAQYRSSSAMRSIRYSYRASEQAGAPGGKGAAPGAPAAQGGGASRELQNLKVESNLSGPGSQGLSSFKPLDDAEIRAAPGWHVLDANEQALCLQLRALPATYLHWRATIGSAPSNAGLAMCTHVSQGFDPSKVQATHAFLMKKLEGARAAQAQAQGKGGAK